MSSLAAQYATSANLAARIALHQRCSTNTYGLQRWIFDRLDLREGERVLEIACGTGSLWRENADRSFDIEFWQKLGDAGNLRGGLGDGVRKQVQRTRCRRAYISKNS